MPDIKFSDPITGEKEIHPIKQFFPVMMPELPELIQLFSKQKHFLKASKKRCQEAEKYSSINLITICFSIPLKSRNHL